METNITTPCPNTVTVRRNPPRKARATPSSTVPLPMPSSTPSASISRQIPSFPIDDILSIELPQNPKPDPLTTQQPSSIQQPLCENLKVFLRIRPLSTQQSSGKNTKNVGALNSRSKNVWPQNPSTKNAPKAKAKKKSEICLKVNDSHSVTLCPPRSLQDLKRIKSEVYEGFSHVFSADSSQEEVYKQIVNPLVEDFMKGKSGMFAALGPSGSGKTHTVFGTPREPGMVPLALRQIFLKTEASGTHSLRTFYVSMFEIYAERGKAERIFDLSPDGGDPCLQQSTIKGLKEALVYDAQQAESLISLGMAKRATAMTNSNNQSSRSQCIINIRSDPTNIDGEVDDQSHSAVLTIVDLAGAEREKKTGNQGARLLESNFINNTSMVFGLCLRSLLEHQKNPKKPLQKHFQSSLLTKYLRDYLEGKKRMTLILTVKSGEEDYLDASFLLRQASPYMKIKFDNVEEPLNMITNKRNLQALPRVEHLKRMKLSSAEACLANEGKGDEDYQPNKAEVPLELNDNASADENVAKLAKRDRDNQIMKGFAKALWNVLKQYKKKVEVAENEIQCLRDNLTNEKARSSKLENEVNNLKSCHLSGKEVSEEMSIVDGVDESRTDEFAESEGNQSTDVSERGDNSPGIVHNAKDVKDMKDLGREDTCMHGKPTGSGLLESPVSSSHLLADNTDNVSSSVEGNLFQNEAEGYQGVTSSKFEGSEQMNNKKSCDTIAKSFDVGIDLCRVFEEPIYKKGDGSPRSVHNAEDLQGIEDVGTEDICSNSEAKGSGLFESPVSSSHLLAVNTDNASSSVEGNLFQNEAEVYQGVTSSNLEGSEQMNNKKNCDTIAKSFDVAIDLCCGVFEEQIYKKGDVSPQSVHYAEDLQDSEDLRAEDICSNIEAKGSGLLESVVSSSQPLVILTDDSSSSVEGNHLQNEVDMKSLDEPVMPNKDVTSAIVCSSNRAPEFEPELVSCSKPLNPEKPKRRLLPASSVLLRNINNLDFEDENENEKRKGNRGEKKVVADVTKRTQGSISLLRLLKDNLHL